MMNILTSEFFWGIIIGLMLTIVGSYALSKFQTNEQQKARVTLIRKFSADSIANIQHIVEQMTDVRGRTNAIHHDFLTLLDVEIGVFGRNREHTIYLPENLRERVRKFMNDCAIKRAEIGNFLNDFYAKNAQADQFTNQGNQVFATPLRQQAVAALTNANKAADQLSLRAKDAPTIISELKT